jgi:chemotaxis protein CheC
MIELDDDIRDALAETFNMALGEASVQFAELVNEEIELSVPQVELVSRATLVQRIDSDAATDDEHAALCRIAQDFSSDQSDIDTRAILLFPEKGSLEIVRRMLGDTGISDERLNELEQDALGEIGNIIINSCMNSLAHVFDREMSGTLPEVRVGPSNELFAALPGDETAVLLARIGMRMATRRISGHVIFMMDMASLQVSIQQIRQFFGMACEA